MLDAALDLFAQGGFAEASMEALARKAGTTKPVLYDCFPGGKEEIYFALLEREEDRFRSHMTGVLASTSHMRLRDSLSAGLSAFLDYADVNPTAFRVLFGPAGSTDPEIVERAARVREDIIGILTSRAARVADPATPPVVIELFERAIVAIAEEIARWWLAAKPMDRDAIVALITGWMMRGFEGMLPPEAL